MTYQICNCCISSGRAVPACYGYQVEDSNIMAQNPYTNIINQERKNRFYESINVYRVS